MSSQRRIEELRRLGIDVYRGNAYGHKEGDLLVLNLDDRIKTKSKDGGSGLHGIIVGYFGDGKEYAYGSVPILHVYDVNNNDRTGMFRIRLCKKLLEILIKDKGDIRRVTDKSNIDVDVHLLELRNGEIYQFLLPAIKYFG